MKHTNRQRIATYAKLALAWVAGLFGAKRAPGRETSTYDSPRKLRRAERAATRRKYARALFKLRASDKAVASRRTARAVARRKAFASAARKAIDALRAEQRKTGA